MKKILILLFPIMSVVGCNNNDDAIIPKIPIDISFPEGYYNTETAIRKAREYNINVSEIEINTGLPKKYDNDSIIIFTGEIDEKLWIGVYDCDTKSEIHNGISTKNYNREIKTYDPYIEEEVADTVEYFYISNRIIKDDTWVFHMHEVTKKEKGYSSAIFSKNSNIYDFERLTSHISLKEWSNNSIFGLYIEKYMEGFTTVMSPMHICFSITGEVIFRENASLWGFNFIPTNDLYEGIHISGLGGYVNSIITRNNVLDRGDVWRIMVSNEMLSIPPNVKQRQISHKYISKTILQVTYDVILSDGIEMNKAIDININNGEYSII